MNPRPLPSTHRPVFPQVLPMRQRAEVIRDALEKRLATILPAAMRETGFDMWIILCQEDDLDPIFKTLIPMNTWCPILQMLILTDRGGEGVERINLSMTHMQGLYDKPWSGQQHEEQWPLLAQIVKERDPQRIGVNTGSVQWAAGGLTHNLHTQLVHALSSRYADRLTSAEPLATRWLATLTENDLVLYEHVVDVAHALLAECYSRRAIIPGVTTTDDLEWVYWQRAAEMGLEMAFKPFFNLLRSQAAVDRFGAADRVIRPGDLIHSDVGIRYLRLNSDHQEWCYVLRAGETDAPEGIRKLMAEGNRLQDVFMAEFQRGLTGNQLLSNILSRARSEGIPQPKVYSHSLGLFLHEPGPLIGLPWEQERCEGRGEVKLAHGQCFTMELSVSAPIPEWDGQEVRMSLEEDVSYTEAGCRPIGGRQAAFYLV